MAWHHQVVDQHCEPGVREALYGALEQIAELMRSGAGAGPWTTSGAGP